MPAEGSRRLWAVLLVLGAGWGLTQPLGKIAVSDGHAPLGLIFWQLVITVVILAPLAWWRGRGLPLGRAQIGRYLAVALLGTVLPNSTSYLAALHLPSGILSIVISAVPFFALPMAVALGQDRASPGRLAGLALGLAGVALIAGPEASLPDRAMLAFLPLALVAPFFYAVEGNLVARLGTAGLDPVQLLLGAALMGAALSLPLAWLTGGFVDPRLPWGADDRALVAASVIHGVVYTVYLWLIGRAGSVFAAQVGYLVTGFGVLWAMLLLGERYAWTIWLALGLMLAGVALVQPRRALPNGQASAAPPPPEPLA